MAKTPEETTAIIVFDNAKIHAALTKPEAMTEILAEVKTILDAFEPDITTDKGRKECASMAYRTARTKTLIDGLGKEMVDDIKKQTGKIDAARKVARDTLDAYRDEVRAPLTAWEEEQAKAQSTIEDFIRRSMAPGDDIAAITESLSVVQTIDAADYPESTREALIAAQDEAIAKITSALVKAKQIETDRVELEKLRKDAADREAAEKKAEADKAAAESARIAQEESDRQKAIEIQQAADKARAEAEAKAEQAQKDHEAAIAKANEDAEKAKSAAIEAKAQAERDAKAAQEKAKADADAAVQAEKDRVAALKKAEDAAQARREADKKHRSAVMNTAYKSFVKNGLDSVTAKTVVEMIAAGEVDNVIIQF